MVETPTTICDVSKDDHGLLFSLEILCVAFSAKIWGKKEIKYFPCYVTHVVDNDF